MKTFLAIALLAAPIGSAPALADSSASPLLGSWAVDVSQLPIPPEAWPKSVTLTFSETDNSNLRINVDIVGADGAEMRSVAVASLDGDPVPVTNSIEADIAAVKQPAPNVLVVVLAKAGVPGSTRVYAVDRGGKTMVETATYFGSDGQPLIRTNYFSRVP
jgi:hypothetical protein